MKSLLILMIMATFAFSESASSAIKRDPRYWPFSEKSIWNQPIGSEAIYIEAKIEPSKVIGTYIEEEILVLAPQAPMRTISESLAGWDKTKSRIETTSKILDRVPIPLNFKVEAPSGESPNHAAAILRADGRTLHQSQPIEIHPQGPVTSQYLSKEEDLFGLGISGSHGGSGLSALGGTIRIGELKKEGKIRHAMKAVIDSRFLYHKILGPDYRWPALWADQHASFWTYRGTVSDLKMGSLLALRPNFNVNELETTPGKIIATAARDYGIYVVDSSGWDAFYLATEWSPEGRVKEEFEKEWGMPFVQKELDHPWSRDMQKMIRNLCVIANNDEHHIGGGGIKRAPLAPPF